MQCLKLSLFVTSLLSSYLHASPILEYTMKAISKDAALVAEVAKKVSPTEVTDAMLLTAITRTRTAAYQLRLIAARREGEMIPDKAMGLTDTEQKAKLDLYANYLEKAATVLETIEKQANQELAKADLSTRDYTAYKASLADLNAVIKEAHTLFK